MFLKYALIWFLFLFSLAFPPLFLLTIPYTIVVIARGVRARRLHRAAMQEVRTMQQIHAMAAFCKQR